MTTPHIGDEDELVTADHADNETEQPEQAAQAENGNGFMITVTNIETLSDH